LEIGEYYKDRETIETLAKKYDIHPTQINTWKKEFLEKSSLLFEKGNSREVADNDQLIQTLYAQIGELKVANDFLKKKLL
jgi:transposase-like protein